MSRSPNAFVSLSLAILKGFLRDKAAVFFAIVFPLMFLVLFGGILGDIAARSDDRSDRLADEADLVGCHAPPRMQVGSRPEVRHRIAQFHGTEAGHDCGDAG